MSIKCVKIGRWVDKKRMITAPSKGKVAKWACA